MEFYLNTFYEFDVSLFLITTHKFFLAIMSTFTIFFSCIASIFICDTNDAHSHEIQSSKIMRYYILSILVSSTQCFFSGLSRGIVFWNEYTWTISMHFDHIIYIVSVLPYFLWRTMLFGCSNQSPATKSQPHILLSVVNLLR